jgi:galactokinase
MNDIVLLHRTEYEEAPEIVVRTPARIDLLGEHTEFSDGNILALTVDRSMYVAISVRKDNSLRFFAADLNERKRTTISNLKYKREDRWANYLKGVIFSFLQMGCAIKGLNITVSGDVPQGIGLASSSAIEVSTAIALNALFSFGLADLQLLEAARQAETRFMGKKIGLIDHIVQFGSKLGKAVLIDSRSLKRQDIPFSVSPYRMIITDSKVPRVSVDAELRQRRNDCKQALTALSRKRSGTALRDFSQSDLMDSMGILPESVRRRSLHVIQEIQRTTEAAECLRRGDLSNYGKIVNHSHESLRDLYEVSCPEVDWLVKRALELDGILCSRMIGQGFGGCTITFMRADALEDYKKRLEEYERIFGFKPVMFAVESATGARIVHREKVHENPHNK